MVWLPSGAVSVNVIVPPGLSPPVTFAESDNWATPTTPPSVSDACVLTIGLACTVVTCSADPPWSPAMLLRPSPL